jgi:hypothetical protein
MAITSSSSGGASSRASSRTRASGKAQGPHPVARKKNVGGVGARPAAKGTENVPIPIPVSDSEDARKRGRGMKDVTGAEVETDARNGAPPLNKRQKTSSTSLRKTSSSESKTMAPTNQRLAAPQKPIRVVRSTSFGVSSASNVGTRKKVGLVESDKSAVRTSRVRTGGAGSANESGGQWCSN